MTTERHNNAEENLQGSWVELHFNNGGGSSSAAPAPGAASGEEQQLPSSGPASEQLPGPAAASMEIEKMVPGPAAASMDMEKMLLEAQHESGRSSSRGSLPCDSPPRSQTPLHLRRGSDVNSSGGKNSSQSEEDFLERRREVENLMKKNADWIWDWSSRPENIPPKEFLLKHPKRSSASALSIRNTSMMKKGGIFSAEFLKVFLPSLLVSHILAVGLGLHWQTSDYLSQHLLKQHERSVEPIHSCLHTALPALLSMLPRRPTCYHRHRHATTQPLSPNQCSCRCRHVM